MHTFEAKNPHSNCLYFYTFQRCPFIHLCSTHIGGFIILIIFQTSFHPIKTPTLSLLPTRSKVMIWDWKLTQIICTHAHTKLSGLSDIQWKLMEWHNCYRTKEIRTKNSPQTCDYSTVASPTRNCFRMYIFQAWSFQESGESLMYKFNKLCS